MTYKKHISQSNDLLDRFSSAFAGIKSHSNLPSGTTPFIWAIAVLIVVIFSAFYFNVRANNETILRTNLMKSTAKVADKVDFERESLARIAHELVALKAQVEDAARAAPTMARVQFRYDWLTTDLDLIERAIREHLDAPRQPRAIVPLKGDYRR